MLHCVTSLLVGLVLFGAVDAKHKGRVMVYKFPSGDCNGDPYGKASSLKEDKCASFQAGSFRLAAYPKKEYNKWVNCVGTGECACSVDLHTSPGCTDAPVQNITMPWGWNQCIPAEPSTQTYVKFSCQQVNSAENIASGPIVQIPLTSCTFDVGGTVSSFISTTTVTSISIDLEPTKVAVSLPFPIPTVATLKKEHNPINVWLQHPFAGGAVCFYCWTKHRNRYDKFKCRHGPKWPQDCDPRHVASPTTTMSSTSTSTIEFFFTTTDQFTSTSSSGGPTATLVPQQRRSPHKAVMFSSPYDRTRLVCADAEWEHTGLNHVSVRIEKVKDWEKCKKKKHYKRINIDAAIETLSEIAYTTVTTTLTTRPTWFPTQN